jgi:lambda family phage tail tape measure protein
MQKIAVAMAGFKDGGEKSAASMFLFGKAGAEALPWLRDLAQAGELHARVTTEQAEAAHQFEVQLGKLKANGEAWRRSLAMDLLPTLNAFADALLGVKKSTGEVGHDLAEYLIPIMQNLAVWTIDAVYYFNKLAVTIGGTAAGYKAFFSGDFEGAKNIGKLMSEDAEKAKKKVDELSNAIRGIGLQSFDPNNQSAAEFARLTRKKDLTGLAGDPKGAASSDPINQGLSILDGLKTKYEQITGTVSVYEEAQRKMAAVKNGVSDAIRREIDAFAKLIDKTEAQTKAVDQMTRSQLAEITAREDAEKAADASLTALEKLAEAQQFEVDQLNKLAPAIALARFAREQGVMIRKAESDLVQRGQVEGWNEIKMEQERAKVTRESAAALDAFNKIQADAADQKNNPIRGAKDALKEYTDAIDSAGTISKKVMTDAFKGMEDALVKFVTTGKLDFSSLAQSIITDLVRIQIQQSVMKPLTAAMGGGDILGSLGSLLGFRAAGGPIDAGSPYIVGEKGPELIIPNNSGTVVPNHALGGGGSVTVNQPIVINAQNASAETVGMIRAMMPNIIAENKRVIEGVIQQAMARKGGRLTA